MASTQHPPPPPIRACLFDMDGLLIDSEDLYTVCTNTVLHKYGKPSLPWNIKAQLQGRPGPEAGKIFGAWAQLPVDRDVYIKEVAEQQKKLFPSCKPLPGVQDLLETLKERTDVEMALATSSHVGNYNLKTDHLVETFWVFPDENKILGDDPRIPPGRGKPAPDIYLLALKTLNERIQKESGKEITPAECLVFEDSVPGVEAGRRAGMQIVWVPHEGLLNEMRGKEDRILAGLMGEHKEIEEKNEEIGVVDPDSASRHKGPPGEIGDGWGRLLLSLEKFPYESYGIKVS